MKTNSDTYPKKILPLGNGQYHINFNIEEVEIEGRQSYDYETVVVGSNERVDLIEALIAHRYSLAEELKILYRGTPEEVREHEDWVAWCKSYVDELGVIREEDVSDN